MMGEEPFWGQIRSDGEQAALEWADYRVRVGEYYFRAYKPGLPELNNYLDLALGEFNAVLALAPNHPRATQLKKQILANQNILGMARDYDLVPDFPRYEKVVTDYGPMVLSLVQTATNMLLTSKLSRKCAGISTWRLHISEIKLISSTQN